MKINDLRWLAGFLEGEGSFINASYKRNGGKRYPRISATSTDKDVLCHAAEILDTRAHGPYLRKGGHYKPIWSLQVMGNKAIGRMMTLYSLMGIRRRESIAKVIREWKQTFR